MKKLLKISLVLLPLLCSLFGALNLPSTPVYADETTTETTQDLTCYNQTGAVGWIICPATEFISNAIDTIYDFIQQFLVVAPIRSDDTSPIYVVWEYARNITNIVFIIFILVIVFSQLTGAGINNYNIKKTLPRIIVAAVLVNLSFIICALALDVSNIIGASLVDFFKSIETSAAANTAVEAGTTAAPTWASITSVILAGAGTVAVAGASITAAGGVAALILLLLPIALGALLSIIVAALMVILRQALVVLLVMISPLAFVCYLLPNTENLFQKWKNLFVAMLVFYPLFSLLFGACSLAGWAILASAKDLIWLIIGLAVQVLPLILCIPLMKTSGTFLDKAGNIMNKLSSTATGKAQSSLAPYRENARAKYLSNNPSKYNLPRRTAQFFAYRKSLLNTDLENNLSAAQHRADARAYKKVASYEGRDADGNDIYAEKPNKYTRNAKQAEYLKTKAETSKQRLENTTSRYGTHFQDTKSQKLSAKHGEAYKDAMAQQYLKINQAQADQDWLLKEYTTATNQRNTNPTEYNRLIKNAAGDLAHLGEASIMGQVIAENSRFEARRRTEARIIFKKFGTNSDTFRSMMVGYKINGDGYAVDENDQVVEDSQHRLLPGKHRVEWDKYIIKDGRRVNYFDITDDQGNPVQRVFADDSGYIKELLADDILVGDSINRFYNTQIGLGDANHPAGKLRKYRNTITDTILASKYKEHASECSPMLEAQANAGYINTPGQYNIANLQSFTATAKANAFLVNDRAVIDELSQFFSCVNSDDPNGNFDFFFSDADIDGYRDVKGKHLKGLRLTTDTEGNQSWQTIDRNDPTITTEDRKNFVKHSIIPKAASKAWGLIGRTTPNILENQKPPTLEALLDMLSTIQSVAEDNLDPTLSIHQKLNPDTNITGAPTPDQLKQKIREIEHAIAHNNYSAAPTTSTPLTIDDQVSTIHDSRIDDDLRDIFESNLSLEELCSTVAHYFSASPTLSPHLSDLQLFLSQYPTATPSTSIDDVIENTTNHQSIEDQQITEFQSAITDFINQIRNI